LGSTNPPYPVGQVLNQPYPVSDLSLLTISIGGLCARLLWAGVTGAGVYQTNVQVPEVIADGELPVTLSIAGQAAQQALTLPLKWGIGAPSPD
jgi:uncharacterized protein (TIGR03437 family)